MTVLEILETASLYLNLREEFDYYFNDNNLVTPSNDVEYRFGILLKALNLVIVEIATEFKPLYFKEIVNFENNKFQISQLTQSPLKIVEVSDNLKTYKFKITNGYIEINCSGNKSVRYSIIPEELSQTDSIYYFNTVYQKPLAFGACMEFCRLMGDSEESKIWEGYYYKSLKNCLKLDGTFKMPKRRWL